MERGPLWRVSLLKEHFDGERYENSLLITFHHMVCDGASIMTLYKAFLRYLNDLHQGKEVNVESMTLSPPLDAYIDSKLHANLPKKCLFKVLPILMQIKRFFVKPDLNVYLAAFPPPILHNRSIVKRTSVIPVVLRKDEVSELIKLGKNHGCTFHSIITAATRLAMAQILKSSTRNLITSDPVSFENSFNISLRNDAQPPIPAEEFGLFISAALMDIPSPSGQVTPSMFWSFAKQCHDLIRQIAVKSEDRFLFPLMAINAGIERLMSVNTPAEGYNCGRFPVAFNISNRGRFAIGQPEDVFQFAGTYFAMSEHSRGPPFGNNVVSVNGDLYWGLIYFPNVATKQQAENFLELTLEILRVAASSTERDRPCGGQVTH